MDTTDERHTDPTRGAHSDIPALRRAWNYGREGSTSIEALADLRQLDQVDPCGEPFNWGTVTTWHHVGPYCIAESTPDHPVWHNGAHVPPEDQEGPSFHGYILEEDKWIDTNHGHGSLDAALVFCVAYAAEGCNTRAHTYFMRSLDRTRPRAGHQEA